MPNSLSSSGGLAVEIDGVARRLADVVGRPLTPAPVVTPVPLAPVTLIGLAQVDGEVVPVLRPGGIVRDESAILVETTLGRVILICGRVLPNDTEGTMPLFVEPLVEALRHSVRG